MTIDQFAEFDLEFLLEPKSVAVVGASPKEGSIGISIIDNLIRIGTNARIYPVNPKYSTVSGLTCYPSLRELPEPVDCVFVGVRAELGPTVLREAAEVGIRAAVVNATGYASGGLEGIRLMEELIDVARSGKIAVCGPNNIGYMNVRKKVGLWSLRNAEFTSGPVALITHSGTAAMVLSGDPHPLGLAYVVTCGDEAVVSAADYLAYVVEDETVQVVMLFIETIRNPAVFLGAARRAATLGKKIIVLKVGRSEIGARAVAAHTGGIAGEEEVYGAVFRQLGLAQVRDLDEMVQTAHLLSAYPESPAKPGFVPITMSGGIGALVADLSADASLALPRLTDETRDRIRAANPALWTPQNPLDAWGLGFDPDRFPGVLSAVTDQPDIGGVGLVLDIPGSGKAETSTALSAAPILAESMATTGVRHIVINSNSQGTTHPVVSELLAAAGIPCLMGVSASLRAIGHWVRWPVPTIDPSDRPVPQAGRLPSLAENISTYLAQTALLAHAGIPVPKAVRVASGDQAAEQAEAIGYPVAVKGIHPEVMHKTEAGLVHLDVRDAGEARSAFARTESALEQLGLDPSGAEILVQSMVKAGLELIVAARNVPGFGTLVVVGMGGVYVEVFRRAACRMAPLDRETVAEMLDELGLRPILEGVRHGTPYDTATLIDAVLAVSEIGLANQDHIKVVELNPLALSPGEGGVVALDLLIEHDLDLPAPVRAAAGDLRETGYDRS